MSCLFHIYLRVNNLVLIKKLIASFAVELYSRDCTINFRTCLQNCKSRENSRDGSCYHNHVYFKMVNVFIDKILETNVSILEMKLIIAFQYMDIPNLKTFC
jgi:hypothetical protein